MLFGRRVLPICSTTLDESFKVSTKLNSQPFISVDSINQGWKLFGGWGEGEGAFQKVPKVNFAFAGNYLNIIYIIFTIIYIACTL